MTEAEIIAGIVADQEAFDARLLRSLEKHLTGEPSEPIRVFADLEIDA